MGTTAADQRTDVPPQRAEPGSEWGWMLRVVTLVVAFAIVAWARSRQVDVPFKDPHGKLFRAKLPDTAEFLLVAIVTSHENDSYRSVSSRAARSRPSRSCSRTAGLWPKNSHRSHRRSMSSLGVLKTSQLFRLR
jgi:hypothetical protein